MPMPRTGCNARGEYTQGSGFAARGGREGCRYRIRIAKIRRSLYFQPSVFIPPMSIHVIYKTYNVDPRFLRKIRVFFLSSRYENLYLAYFVSRRTIETQRSRVDRKLNRESPFENYYSRFQIYRFVKYSNYIDIEGNTYISSYYLFQPSPWPSIIFPITHSNR